MIKYVAFLLAMGSAAPTMAGTVDSWQPGQGGGALDSLLQPQVSAPSQSIEISAVDLARMRGADLGETIRIPSLQTGLSKSSTLELRRISLHAPGARNIVPGEGTVPRSDRRFFLATDRYAGLGLIYDPVDDSMKGLLIQGDERYRIRSAAGSKAGNLVLEVRSFGQEPVKPTFQCELDAAAQATGLSRPTMPYPSLNAMPKGGGLIYQATIAVDTDNEFMLDKFGDDTTAAAQWIEDLFMFLNVIYERDFAMRLLLGTTILRESGTADPYSDNVSLEEFSMLWLNDNQLQAINRSFAMLLSGQIGNPLAFSGRAWLEVYCVNTPSFQNQVFGSFSINRIGSDSLIDPAFSSGGIGHELGHNLGSRHTHCEKLRDGGNDWVDRCYNEFNGDGSQNPDCYYGATECVADRTGSMMSYCHAPPDGFDGGGPDVGPPDTPSCDNSSEFDPLVITKLNGLIQANNPSCILDFDDDFLFADSFEGIFGPLR